MRIWSPCAEPAVLEREVGDLQNIIGGDDAFLRVEAEEQEENDDTEDIQSKKKKNKKNAEDQGVKLEKSTGKRKSKQEEDQEFLMKYVLVSTLGMLDSRLP